MELSSVFKYIVCGAMRTSEAEFQERCGGVDRIGEERYCVVQRWLFRGRERRRAARPQHRSMDKN